MRAMIFAAGLGTRLRPLTNDRPKAMVSINGKPLLQITIERLKAFGYDRIIVNTHHFAKQIFSFLKANDNFGIRIAVSDERALLLNTGGGLKKAAWFFERDDAPFLVSNTDIITDIDLDAMRRFHLASKAMITLAVRQRQTSRYLLFDKENQLRAWQNIKTGEVKPKNYNILGLQQLGFSGMHLINPDLLSQIPFEGVFSIIDVYLHFMQQHKIMGFRHDDSIWLDVGKQNTLAQAKKLLNGGS